MGTIKPNSKRTDENPITMIIYVIRLLPHMPQSLPVAVTDNPVFGTEDNHSSTFFIWNSLNFVVNGVVFVPTTAWYTSLLCKG